jgi:hypothetical protein
MRTNESSPLIIDFIAVGQNAKLLLQLLEFGLSEIGGQAEPVRACRPRRYHPELHQVLAR